MANTLESVNDFLQQVDDSNCTTEGSFVWNDVHVQWYPATTYAVVTKISHEWRNRLPVSHIDEFIDEIYEGADGCSSVFIIDKIGGIRTKIYDQMDSLDTEHNLEKIKKCMNSKLVKNILLAHGQIIVKNEEIEEGYCVNSDNQMCCYNVLEIIPNHPQYISLYDYETYIRVSGLPNTIIRSRDIMKDTIAFPEGIIDIILCYMF